MTVVVLLATELFGDDLDAEKLERTLASVKDVRLLVHATRQIPAVFAQVVGKTGKEVDWLLAPGLTPPDAPARRLVNMFEGTAPKQAELALALSDCILTPTNSQGSPILKRANDLQKYVVALGGSLDTPALEVALEEGLDPQVFRLKRWWPWCAGRLEQLVFELGAFPLRFDRNAMKSLGRLSKCFSPRGLRPKPYFGPEDWEKKSLAKSEGDGSSPIRRAFERFDRSALYGSYVHRDVIWYTHLLAAFAVFAAVAGHLDLFSGLFGAHNHVWPLAEIAVLLVVAGITLWALRERLQHRWTACRFAAEHLRVARLCLPLLVVPSALATVEKPLAGDGTTKEDPFETDIEALAATKRSVRDQGLPLLDAQTSPTEGLDWLRLFVVDQRDYHHNNHHKLELLEKRLETFKLVIFGAAICAVLAHFAWDWKELLLLTASGPALAAAIHGAETRLGIVHRKELSKTMEAKLNTILAKLNLALDAKSKPSWPAVQEMAREAADAMVDENSSWRSLVRRERDFIP